MCYVFKHITHSTKDWMWVRGVEHRPNRANNSLDQSSPHKYLLEIGSHIPNLLFNLWFAVIFIYLLSILWAFFSRISYFAQIIIDIIVFNVWFFHILYNNRNTFQIQIAFIENPIVFFEYYSNISRMNQNLLKTTERMRLFKFQLKNWIVFQFIENSDKKYTNILNNENHKWKDNHILSQQF